MEEAHHDTTAPDTKGECKDTAGCLSNEDESTFETVHFPPKAESDFSSQDHSDINTNATAEPNTIHRAQPPKRDTASTSDFSTIEKYSDSQKPQPPRCNIRYTQRMPSEKEPAIRVSMEEKLLPTDRTTFFESIMYSFNTILWLFYHSVTLWSVAMLVVIIMFGSTWVFQINHRNMLFHFLITGLIFSFASYLSIAFTSLYVFGRKRVLSLIFKVTLPLVFAHMVIYTIRQIYQIPSLTYIYYGIFIFHYYALLKMVQDRNKNIVASGALDREQRYSILASDGTPVALIKRFAVYVVLYYTVAMYLITYLMDSTITIRIIGRVFLMPSLFSIVDLYQNSFLFQKSDTYMRYRMVPSNIMNNISICILRLMITDSPSILDTAKVALTAGFVEIGFRLTCVPRTVIGIVLIQHAKRTQLFQYLSRRKVHNLSSISPQPDSPAQGNNRLGNERELSESGPRSPEETIISLEEALKILRGCRDIDSIRKSINDFHGKGININKIIQFHYNRIVYVSMFELQSGIFIPLVLYLCKPIHEYVTIQTFSGIRHVGLSILIQFSVEVVTQIITTAIENYIYGVELPIIRRWRYNLKPALLVQSTLLLLMSVHLVISPFRPSTEYWPDK